MFVNFRNDPLYMDALEVILQLVSLVYRIRHHISVVFNIAGPLLSREDSCSGEKCLCFPFSAELTNNIKNPGRNNSCRSWKYSEQQLWKVLEFTIRAIKKSSLKFFLFIPYSDAIFLSLWLVLLLMVYFISTHFPTGFYPILGLQVSLFSYIYFCFVCLLSQYFTTHPLLKTVPVMCLRSVNVTLYILTREQRPAFPENSSTVLLIHPSCT